MDRFSSEVKAWLSKHREQVALAALLELADTMPKPGLGLKADRADEILSAWVEPLHAAAQRIAAASARAALIGLFESGIPHEFALAARSQSSRNANKNVKHRKGGRPAVWRKTAIAVLKRRRNLDAAPIEDLIDILVANLVVDRADDEQFECHETGDRIATSRKNMGAEISKLKRKIRKLRAKSGR